jgi:hypothetical protein
MLHKRDNTIEELTSMATLITVAVYLLILYGIYRLIKAGCYKLYDILLRGALNLQEIYEENKEPMKEKAGKFYEELREAAKDSLPAREELTTGRKSATKVIALLVVGMLVGAFSFGAIAISILSNFNFAAGLY